MPVINGALCGLYMLAFLGLAKTLFRNSLDRTWDEQSAKEAETIAHAIATEDHLEGVTAFVEKRKPRFVGR